MTSPRFKRDATVSSRVCRMSETGRWLSSPRRERPSACGDAAVVQLAPCGGVRIVVSLFSQRSELDARILTFASSRRGSFFYARSMGCRLASPCKGLAKEPSRRPTDRAGIEVPGESEGFSTRAIGENARPRAGARVAVTPPTARPMEQTSTMGWAGSGDVPAMASARQCTPARLRRAPTPRLD